MIALVHARSWASIRPMGGGQPSDADLARAIADGARADEARLYERFARRVYLYGLRHLRDEDLAADLVQEVMARVIERLRAGEVREPDRIASFVLGTARMMAHDVRRRARRREDLADRVAAETDAVVGPPEPLPVERLAECLEKLSERERSVVVLSFHAGCSAAEIAEDFGLSPGNVRVIRHRAVARLSDCMGVHGEASA